MELSAQDFTTRAQAIVDTLGTDVSNLTGDYRVYEDERMIVRCGYNGLDLEVVRKPIAGRHPSLWGSNPVLMVKDYKVIRFHGEAHHLFEHVKTVSDAL